MTNTTLTAVYSGHTLVQSRGHLRLYKNGETYIPNKNMDVVYFSTNRQLYRYLAYLVKNDLIKCNFNQIAKIKSNNIYKSRTFTCDYEYDYDEDGEYVIVEDDNEQK